MTHSFFVCGAGCSQTPFNTDTGNRVSSLGLKKIIKKNVFQDKVSFTQANNHIPKI